MILASLKGLTMDELIKLLDRNLNYIRHEIKDDYFYIYVESNRDSFECPQCGCSSTQVHSRYERSFQDLPIQGFKVMIVLSNRKFFCKNPECSYKTFIESFSFIKHKAKKTIRLEDEIVRLSTNVSSVTASKILKNQIANVGKSTICNLLKKRNT